MKRILSVTVSLLLLCGLLNFNFQTALADDINLISNPGFENGATGWNSPNGWAGIVQLDTSDPYEGTNSVKISTTGTENPFVSQTVSNLSDETQYRLSARILISSLGANSNGCFKIDFYRDSSANFLGSKTITTGSTASGEWESFVLPFTTPDTCNKATIHLRLLGTGTVYFDNASLTAPVNYFNNPGFESGNTGWSSPLGWSGIVQISGTTAYSGTNSVMISTSGIENPYISQTSYSVPSGAEFEVDAIIKTSNFVSGSAACFKIDFYDSDRHHLGSKSETYTQNTNGQWKSMSFSFDTPENCQIATVCLRLLGTGTVYFDDAMFVMTKAPEAIFLNTDWVFYYTDMESGTATVTLNPYYTELYQGTADFYLKDGGTTLASSTGNSLTAGAASFTYSMSYLSVEKHEYTITVNVKDSGGVLQETAARPIYKYDRPAYLGSDGIYLKNGTTPFDPIFAYHVSTAHYPYCAAAGINVVQSNLSGTVAEAEAYLDAAEANGLMVLLTLYYGMNPAGHESNVARTEAIVTALNSHPALFAYAVMDEPFLGLPDPADDLRNSYKIIRDIDDDHPVYIVEGGQSYYPEAAKYADILAADPYPSGSGLQTTCVKSAIELAMDAVRGEKPVYSLVQAFRWNGYYPTGGELRHMLYQSFIAGAKAVGYFSYSDSDKDANGNYIPLHNSTLWPAMTSFYSLESVDAFGVFVHGDYPLTGSGETDGVLWKTYEKNDDVYAILLNLEDESKTVSIPVTNDLEFSRVAAVNGCTADSASVESGTLTAELTSNQAAVYRIISQHIKNGGFESLNPDNTAKNWSHTPYNGTIEMSTDSPYEGTYSAKIISASGQYPFVSQNISTLVPGSTYELSFYFKTTGTSVTPFLKFEYGTSQVYYSSSVFSAPAAGEWTYYTLQFTVPAAATQATFLVRGTSAQTVFYDDISIETVQ